MARSIEADVDLKRADVTVLSENARIESIEYVDLLFASDRDDEARRLDTAAGCEFVDDRIHSRE